MQFEELIQLQVLKQKALNSGRLNRDLLEQVIEEGGADLPLRQMCAKVSVELYLDLENTCNALDMTKREFIEAAVSDAIRRAKVAFEKAGGVEAVFGLEDKGRL